MLLTVAPPVCVAKYSTTKTTEHTQTHTQTDRQHGTLKLNSVNAVEFKNSKNKSLENNKLSSIMTKM